MNQEQAERNVKLFYVYDLFLEPFFWGPILIMFIQRAGRMTLSEIMVMEAMVVAGLIFLEVPSGALADIIGRKKTIFIGVCLFCLDRFLFTVAFNPLMIWAANIIWMIGYSMISGASSSFLYDSLKFLGRENEFKRIYGQAASYRLTVIAVTSFFAGYLAEIHLRLPMILSSFGMFVNCFVVPQFVEPPKFEDRNLSWRSHFDLMKVSVLFVVNHKQIKWVIAFTVLIGATSKVWFFTYNPYFELVDIPIHQFGWIFCVLSLVAAISSNRADWIARKFGDLGSVIMMIVMIGAPILVMGTVVAKVTALLVVCQNVVRGYIGPFTGHFLHSRLNSENRATVVSIKSAICSLGQVIMLSVAGGLLRIWPLSLYLQVLGGFTLVVGSIIIFCYLKIFKED